MEKFDELFHDNLKDGEAEPPSFIWDNIEAEIEEENRKKGGFFLFGWGGMLVLFGVIVAIAWWTNSYKIEEVPAKKITVDLSGNLKNNTKEVEFSNTLMNSTGSIDLKNATVPKVNNGDSFKLFIGEQEPIISQEKRMENLSRPSHSKTIPSVTRKTKDNKQKVVEKESVKATEKNKLNNNQSTFLNDGLIAIIKNSKNENDTFANLAVVMQEKKDEKNVFEVEDSIRMEGDSIKQDIVNSYKDSLMEIVPIQLTALVDSNLIAGIIWDSVNEQTKKEAKRKRFFVQAKVGFSTYAMSLWDQSFEFGMLSRRSFSATGINVDLRAGYEINAWLNPIVGLNYNTKQAKFNYSALYDDHGYLIYNIRGGLLPLNEINDQDFLCNSHLIENIEADFSIQSFSLTLGNKFKLLQKGKIGIDLDLSYSLELGAGVIGSIQKIDVSNNLKDSFNSRINAGINVNYQLNDQFKLFIDMEYIFMPKTQKTTNFYRSDLHELIFSTGLRFNF